MIYTDYLRQLGEIRLNYSLFGLDIHYNMKIVTTSQILVIIISGLFVLPVVVLLYVQLCNFYSNRTTNERYGGKKYKKAKIDDRKFEDRKSGTFSEQDSESIYSATTSLLAENLILDYGKPKEFSDRRLKCCLHFNEMCCNHKIPDQL